MGVMLRGDDDVGLEVLRGQYWWFTSPWNGYCEQIQRRKCRQPILSVSSVCVPWLLWEDLQSQSCCIMVY